MRTPGTRTRRAGAVVGAAAAAGVVTGLVVLLPAGDSSTPLGGGEPAFAPGQLTWAQGSTVHHGTDSYDVGTGFIRTVLPTRYGFFLDLADSGQDDAAHRLTFFDGTDLAAVPGHASGAAVSPDGRYAGWIDFDGPLRPAGRVAEVVVVDLAEGEVVLRDHDHMGGDVGDDLGDRYEELEPVLVGFDDAGGVHWLDAEGSGRHWRADLATGEKELVVQVDPFEDGRPPATRKDPYHPLLGHRVGWSEGELVPLGAGQSLYLSPDRRYGVDTSRTGRVTAVDLRTGEVVDLDRRWTGFAGWKDPTTLWAMATDRRPGGYDPERPDRSTGAMVECRLPSGRCTDLVVVTGTRSVRFGHGLPYTTGSF